MEIALNCLEFLRKLRFYVRIFATDKRTNSSRSRCRKRRLNNLLLFNGSSKSAVFLLAVLFRIFFIIYLHVHFLNKQVYRRRYESRRSSKLKLHKKQQKYGEKKRFSIWRMEFLHSAMWLDHDIDFARWLHPSFIHSFIHIRLMYKLT